MRLRQSPFLTAGLVASFLSAGAARAGCNLENIASIPIRVENGHIFVSGRIDTHPVDFLVDPASRTLLLRAAAVDFGIHPDKLLSLQEKTLLGVKEGGPAALEVDHLPIIVAGEVDNFGAPQEVAVLGTDFLAVYDVEFDVEHGQLNLFRPTGCEATRLGYWSRSASEADMVANPIAVNIPPFTAYNFPHVNFRLSVNGKEMLAALEPEFTDSSLSFAAANTLGVGRDTAGVSETGVTHRLLDGYVTRTWSGPFEKVSLDRETITPAKIGIRTFAAPAGAVRAATGSSLQRYLGNQEDMVLGSDFLISHRVFIAYSQSKIYFSPVADRPYLGGIPAVASP